MSRKLFLFQISVLVMMMFVNHPSWGRALVCDKAVIAGEPNFPPFSYMKNGQLEGAGVDLGKLLFHELNIPVEVKVVQQERDLEFLLRSGRVDMLVATYDIPRYEKITRKVLPPYFEDTLAIVTPADRTFAFRDWHDLMGKNGITPQNNQLGREFQEFAREYLAIDAEGNLRMALRKLELNQYDYAVGSAQMLKDGLRRFDNQKFHFLPSLISTEDVYFGFSEASPCKAYTAYFRNRIEQLARERVVFALLQHHISDAD